MESANDAPHLRELSGCDGNLMEPTTEWPANWNLASRPFLISPKCVLESSASCIEASHAECFPCQIAVLRMKSALNLHCGHHDFHLKSRHHIRHSVMDVLSHRPHCLLLSFLRRLLETLWPKT